MQNNRSGKPSWVKAAVQDAGVERHPRPEILEKVAAGYKREHKLTLSERRQRLASIRKAP
jgi:hypothetical protein